MLRVYIWFQAAHMKLEVTEDDEVYVFDGASNVVATLSAVVVLQQIEHALHGVALEAMMRAAAPRPPVALPARTEPECFTAPGMTKADRALLRERRKRRKA